MFISRLFLINLFVFLMKRLSLLTLLIAATKDLRPLGSLEVKRTGFIRQLVVWKGFLTSSGESAIVVYGPNGEQLAMDKLSSDGMIESLTVWSTTGPGFPPLLYLFIPGCLIFYFILFYFILFILFY